MLHLGEAHAYRFAEAMGVCHTNTVIVSAIALIKGKILDHNLKKVFAEN
jgi:hypothetical protein